MFFYFYKKIFVCQACYRWIGECHYVEKCSKLFNLMPINCSVKITRLEEVFLHSRAIRRHGWRVNYGECTYNVYVLIIFFHHIPFHYNEDALYYWRVNKLPHITIRLKHETTGTRVHSVSSRMRLFENRVLCKKFFLYPILYFFFLFERCRCTKIAMCLAHSLSAPFRCLFVSNIKELKGE